MPFFKTSKNDFLLSPDFMMTCASTRDEDMSLTTKLIMRNSVIWKYYLGPSKTTNCVANDKDCRPRQSLSPKTEFVFWTTTKFVVDDRLCLWRQYLSFSNIKQKDNVCRWRQSLSSCNKVCLFVTVAEDKVCHGRQSLS